VLLGNCSRNVEQETRAQGGDIGLPRNFQECKWDRKDLVRRLCHALDIAEQAIRRLASDGYTDSAESAISVRPEKLISETAVLLVAASPVAHHYGVRARIEGVAQHLIPYARSKRMLLGVCLEPSLALDYAQAHICLQRLGYPDPGFDELLRQSLNSQARAGRERVPHRLLEQEWITEIWNNRKSGPRRWTSPAALNSALNHPMDLLNGTRDDVYAFTHALIYVRDFNIHPRRLPRRTTVILAEAEAVLGRCLDEQDYDLGAEVLIAWPLTRKSWSAAAAFCFQVLAHVEDRAGFLPAPITRLQRLDELEGDNRSKYLLATAYHTAYVMGLLCAIALQPGRTPPSEVPTRASVPGTANLILQFLEADGRTAHWQDELDQLNSLQKDAIAGLLLSIALRRKVRQRNFGAVYKLLKLAYALGLADMPVSSQGAEMLERLDTFANITRAQRPSPSDG
jgi:hypothetical protein